MDFLLDLLVSLGLIFGGCCSNVYALESLINLSSNSGHLITLTQFIIVAADGLRQHFDWKTWTLKERKVPVSRWALLVLLFFCTSILNNWVFSFQIPMSLHIIFRSSTIMVSMLLSWIIFQKTFSFRQMFGVLLVSIGIIKCTLSSTPSGNDMQSDWIIGVGMLCMTVLAACLLGIAQENTYQTYGKHWQEGLFYTHFLALPLFLIFKNQISASIKEYSELGAWPYLALNVITQFVCVSGVHLLSSRCTSVTLNLILTIRKFVSLLISVLFFKSNSFGMENWIGVGLVITGTVFYSSKSRNSKEKEI